MDTDTTYRQLYRETIPSVVSVYLAPEAAGGRAPGGAGSGFVFDERGYVVTNAHVVGEDGEVDLRFADGDWRTGTVEGTDAYTDLAVVFVEDLPESATPLPVARDNPEPGEPVAAFGNPMGLDGTMTTGVISGTSRSTPTGNGFAIPDTIQTDAAINPGNSGGPLVTLEGTVVGVNRARSGDNIGFAISPRILNRVAPALIDYGAYRHSYLRIRTVDVSPTVAEANDLDGPGGVLVVDVGRGPARSVLRASRGSRRVRGREVPVGGDVIVGIDGREIASHEELTRYLVTETEPGQVVEVELLRNGRPRTERVELGERPQAETRRRRGRRRSVGD
jgi:S1-C subfamily serine protease